MTKLAHVIKDCSPISRGRYGVKTLCFPILRNVSVHAGAGANRIAVAVNVVDPADWGPEFVLAKAADRIPGLFPRVRVAPFVRD